jgi:hypothetical protein
VCCRCAFVKRDQVVSTVYSVQIVLTVEVHVLHGFECECRIHVIIVLLYAQSILFTKHDQIVVSLLYRYWHC